jgi:hypothetical protein
MIRLAESGGGTPLYQLKITLLDYKPSIWRRVVVRSDMKLDRLHNVIQTAMGWTNSHLHQFVAEGGYYGMKGPDLEDEVDETLDEKRHVVNELISKAKDRFIYEYDFGDSWEHEVVLEKILPPDSGFKHPVCLEGANACPPEDCGGVGGYADFLEAMADPRHEEHEQMKDWIGGKWDAKKFAVEKVNLALKRMKA